MTLTWTSLWRFGYVAQDLTISFTYLKNCVEWGIFIYFFLTMLLSVSKRQTLCEPWNCLLNQTSWVEKMPTCVLSEWHPSCLMWPLLHSRSVSQCISITFIHVRDPSWVMYYDCIFVSRCKKKVPATKRFTVHRTSNVLTLSLKRFANFSGGKITKVNKTFSRSWLFFFFNEFCLVYQWSHVSVLSFFSFCFRMLVTQNSWTSAPTCLRAQATLSCMASTPFWCTRATVVTLATTTAMSR